jgi:type I restriction enzyme, S subunit
MSQTISFIANGSSWLDELPSHWSQKRLKYAVNFVGGGTPPTGNPEYWSGDIPWVSPKDMKSSVIYDTEEHISQKAISDSPATPVPPGSVLIVVRSGILKHTIPVAINAVTVTLNQDMKAILPNQEVDAKYMYFLIAGCQDKLLLEWRKNGATVESLEHEYIANTFWPFPPVLEQQRIATFLDAKTAEIDEVIAMKDSQVQLLQKKRLALISRAVTKGLDPNVPLRESGVEWLGKIPDGWEWRRIKTCVSFITSGSRGWAEYYNYNGEGAAFVRIGNLTRNTIGLDLNDVQFVIPPQNTEGRRTRVAVGDVLISITAYIGSVAVVDKDMGEAYVSQHIALVRTNTNFVLPDWVGYCLLSSVGQEQFGALVYGGAKEGLGLEDVANLYLLVPGLNEQTQIVDYLNHETRYIDSLIVTIKEQIEKLRTYRQALITAAVMGKINASEVLR